MATHCANCRVRFSQSESRIKLMSDGAVIHEVCVALYTVSKRNNNGTGKELKVSVVSTVQAVEGSVEINKPSKGGQQSYIYK